MNLSTLETSLVRCGIDSDRKAQGSLEVFSPIDGSLIARLEETTAAEESDLIEAASEAFKVWRDVPAPRRGELVRLWGEELRILKADIGNIITHEVGKIIQEGLGEVQEAIDICELAVGQSRQLFGKTIASERPGHRIMEQWHPLGPVGIITAFNFPCAVFAWNAANALICGNPIILKPSEKSPLSGLAAINALKNALKRFGDDAPDGLVQLVIGGRQQGEMLVDSPKMALISATGSVRMGRTVGERVAARFGRRILELGGNNGMIVSKDADLDMAVRAIVFGAVGTAGQRCTTLRRLIVHQDVCAGLAQKLVKAYRSLSIGDPGAEGTLVGPLIDRASYEQFDKAIELAIEQGGKVLQGGSRVLSDEFPQAYYVEPAIIEMPAQTEVVRQETFAPILYVMQYQSLDEAINMHNDVPQGLSSCIFSNNLREVEQFLSASGSDCGMANVNIGPSGAEIGGAFGGEKETGGDRESGSDTWRNYMRRTTNTINFSSEMPLAQGISFA